MDRSRKPEGQAVKELKDLFGNLLSVEIIKAVASQFNFDVDRSASVLLEMTNNVSEKPLPVKKTTPRKPPNNEPPAAKSPGPKKPTKSRKTIEIDRVAENIRRGYKVLVILRGLPGSGKSSLAQALTSSTIGPGCSPSEHILSTDDFFCRQRGYYFFEPHRLGDAHDWNHQRAFKAMSRGVSPVIIDNTNVQMWEMKPYAMMAVDNGYVVEILEPDTWWCFNDKELGKKNGHGVARPKIKEMMDRFEKNVTADKLMSAYNITYKYQKPPQFRLLPPLNLRGTVKSQSTPSFASSNLMDFRDCDGGSKQQPEVMDTAGSTIDDILNCRGGDDDDDHQSGGILQPQKAFSNLFAEVENAWGINEKALNAWDIVTPLSSEERAAAQDLKALVEHPVITEDKTTAVDSKDLFLFFNPSLPSQYKVLTARSRDINLGVPLKLHPPPRKTMIDKGSMTDEEVMRSTGGSVLKSLKDLFPRLPTSYLQELYDKCNRDFHWTVDVLLEDNSQDNFSGVSQGEEVEVAQEMVEEEPLPQYQYHNNSDEVESAGCSKGTASKEFVELRRCLESKIDIGKEHYSEHVYKVKQRTSGTVPRAPKPSTSSPITDSDSSSDFEELDSTECGPHNTGNGMVEVNIGETFVDHLEELFGGEMGLPKGFQPVVQMPTSLARQIYSFYVESICQQMENQQSVLDDMVKEDEEFAKQLQSQEERVAAGRGEGPNLREIMEQQGQTARAREQERRAMTADSLADVLTRRKLVDSFPTVDKVALLELLASNGGDYDRTVEYLISFVGQPVADDIRQPPLSKTVVEEMKRDEDSFEDFEAEGVKPATFYRAEANKHCQKRAELFDKARSHYQNGMMEVASFYSELAKKETRLFDKANHLAAAAFADEHSQRLQKFDTLDLHYLYVKEAIPTMDIFIDRNINLLKSGEKKADDLFIITGRGNHSEGGISKIKPAVMKRLKKRNISYVQLNPGLLKIKVKKNSLITSDLSDN